jgi:transposase
MTADDVARHGGQPHFVGGGKSGVELNLRARRPSEVHVVDTSDVLETGSMAKRKRRKFADEYKAEVVRLVRASGKSVGQVAHELDLTETAVRAWVRQAGVDEKRDPQGPLTSEERAELTRLRRELKTTMMERDFLRKAAAFFAKSGR